MKENLLIILIKYPAAGKVKTRLAFDIGRKNAARVYRQIAGTVVKNTSPDDNCNYNLQICFSPSKARNMIRKWLTVPAIYSLQQRGNIGRRMSYCFKKAFREGYKKVVLTGSDCPALMRPVILHAFRSLEQSDVVVGPAIDGGYYLIGMKRHVPELFQKIEWSTNMVLAQTLDRIKCKGLSFIMLEWLRDIDRVSDLKIGRAVKQTMGCRIKIL